MEYYIKISESEKEDEDVSQELFVLNVSEEHKFYQTVKNANKLLKEHSKVILIGEGKVANKAIAIADTIKRQSKRVTENIEVCSTNYKDVWIPKSKELGLENLEVTRAVPTTKILLVYNLSEEKPQCKSEIRSRGAGQGKEKEGTHRYHNKGKKDYKKIPKKLHDPTFMKDKAIADQTNGFKNEQNSKREVSNKVDSYSRGKQNGNVKKTTESISEHYTNIQQSNKRKKRHQTSKNAHQEREQNTSSHPNESSFKAE